MAPRGQAGRQGELKDRERGGDLLHCDHIQFAEKISVTRISDKRLASRRHKELLRVNNEKATQSKNGQRDISSWKIYTRPMSTQRGGHHMRRCTAGPRASIKR